MFFENLGRGILVLATLSAVGGCASAGGETGATATTAALGTECVGADAEGTFTNVISVTSPQTYNPPYCFKGQVYDVTTYTANTGTDFTSSAPALSTLVKWADATPAVADCANAWVGSDLFVLDFGTPGPGARWSYVGSQSGNGAVVRGACWVPSLVWTTEMTPGRTYRVTASARTYNGSSAPTRKVSVQTYADGVADKCGGKSLSDAFSCTDDRCIPASGAITHAPTSFGVGCCSTGTCNGAGACVGGTAIGAGGAGPMPCQ